MNGGVEPTRDQYQVGLKLPSNWEQQRFTRMHVFPVAEVRLFVVLPDCFISDEACLPRHVDIVATARAFADVAAAAVLSARVEGEIVAPVQRHQHDLITVIE